jgi:hypothetical protein
MHSRANPLGCTEKVSNVLLPVILAHGALGPYDELIFFLVGLAFLVMIGVSWLRSRSAPDDDEIDTTSLTHDSVDSNAPERFRLD